MMDVITDNPLAQSTFPVNESFEMPTFTTDNPLIVNSGMKKHEESLRVRRDKIMQTIESIVSDSSRKINQTRILDSMQLAERVFNTYSRPSKVLVIFSDMIEESDRYNFQRQKVTEVTIASILKEEKQKGRLPDLKGVKVYVVGAGASNYKQPPASSMEKYRTSGCVTLRRSVQIYRRTATALPC